MSTLLGTSRKRNKHNETLSLSPGNHVSAFSWTRQYSSHNVRCIVWYLWEVRCTTLPDTCLTCGMCILSPHSRSCSRRVRMSRLLPLRSSRRKQRNSVSQDEPGKSSGHTVIFDRVCLHGRRSQQEGSSIFTGDARIARKSPSRSCATTSPCHTEERQQTIASPPVAIVDRTRSTQTHVFSTISHRTTGTRGRGDESREE